MGPFYSNDTNELIPENVKGATKINFKTHKRDTKYFHFFTTKYRITSWCW